MTDPVAGNSRSLPCAASIYAAVGAPSPSELDDMWLRLREQDASELRSLERARRAACAPILERAIADEALYGEAA